MKEFKGTRGEVKDVTIELADWSVCNVGTNSKTICSMFYEGVKVPDETLLNQKLIIDAFKVRQQINCELSELLEQRNEMLAMLEELYEDVECWSDISSYGYGNKIEQLIKTLKDE
jgi:hypothetical protein